MPTAAQRDWEQRKAAFERSIRHHTRGKKMVLMLQWERANPKPPPATTGGHTFQGHTLQDLRDREDR